ncbi:MULTISPECIES: hypothetical protein [Primorskyibacter]|uniref:Lipoprotein n=1 Tax=Primorskyibacter flagellatus TaxID=1387277 RepID=A0A1W1YW14_9RHOB|nr:MULTISPECIES: hypothetical protein [Primorskyibacter]SMC40400.1 hypothetical protein SAMN06295998_10126 [Primorskyibacter flagellatus]
MQKALSALVVSALVLASCGTIRESRLNPFNWFGRSQATVVTDGTGAVNPLIPRRRASIFRPEAAAYSGQLIGEVSELLIERRPGGAVIRATGVSDRLGPFEAKLVKNDDETDADTLTYDMRAYQPANPTTQSDWPRTVTVAVYLTDQELRDIREIRVKSARKIQTSRR